MFKVDDKKLQLYPYQQEAVEQLLKKKRAILTNECGSGKTIIALEVVRRLGLKTYIICKKSKIKDWQEEMLKFDMSKVEYIYTNSFESVYKDTILKPNIVIIDESQHMGTFNTRKGKAIISLAKKAEYVFFLSATPSLHKPVELYWPLKLCGVYKETLNAFKLRYNGAYYLPYRNFLVLGEPTEIEELNMLLDKAKVFTKASATLIVNRKEIVVDTGINKYNYKNKLNVPDFEETAKVRHAMAKQKLEIFFKYIDKVGLVDKAVIFAHHRDIIESVALKLNCPHIYGGMSPETIKRYIDIFSRTDKGYLVISMSVGGQGLSIENCKTCYFTELNYSPMQHKQAYYRIARKQNTKQEIDAYFFKIKNEFMFLSALKKDKYFEHLKVN